MGVRCKKADLAGRLLSEEDSGVQALQTQESTDELTIGFRQAAQCLQGSVEMRGARTWHRPSAQRCREAATLEDDNTGRQKLGTESTCGAHSPVSACACEMHALVGVGAAAPA